MNPYPPTDPSSYTPPAPAAPSAPPAGYGPPVGTDVSPMAPMSTPTAPPFPSMAPVPPPLPLARYTTASTGIRLILTAAVLVIAVVIATATLPASLVAARLATFPKPAVSIEASATGNIEASQSVTFTAQRIAGNQLSYTWSFADSNGSPIQDSAGNVLTATGPSTTQSFASYGDVTVSLTATDPTGQSGQASVIAHVLPPPPQASFTVDTSSAFYGCYVTFDASGSTSQVGISEYDWDFGDGNTDSSSYSSSDYHYYSGAGTYTAMLTVKDQYDQSSSTQQTFQVSC